MKKYIVILLSFLPTLAFAQPANDDFASASDVTSIIGSCSADEAYTTTAGTSDLSAASCWNNTGPRSNVWFWFEVPSTGEMYIKVDRGGTRGTQRRTQLAVWKKNGTTQVDCDRYNFNDEDVDLSLGGLTPGDTLYISVDVFNGYQGTFTLCLDSAVQYDLKEGAIDVTNLLGLCSGDAIYTTEGGSGDLSSGSCWNNGGPLYNRWFKFAAPTTGIVKVTIDRGGSKGDQRRTQVSIWEDDGTTELACDRYNFNDEDVDVSVLGLTPGDTFFISVDAFNGYDGSFSLCLDTVADYDYYEGAIDVTSFLGSCSSDAAYDTEGASADRSAASCWNNGGPIYNRWFKFTAPTTGIVNVTVDRGGSKGDQRRTQLAIWESDGTTELACDAYNFNDEDVDVSALGLTPGNTYYISVDAFNGYDGTFTLCIDTVADYDYYEGAIDVTSILGSCSADASYDTEGASGDRSAGSCFNNGGPIYNRWFYFTAPASGVVNIKIDRGGSKGDQRRTQVAVWEADGTTEVACDRYAFNDEDVDLGVFLTPGDTYYITVDAFGGYDGTFTLCIDTVLDYDFYEGAIDVTSILGGCSSDAAYTTVGASGDRSAGSCWNNSGPRYNRWFKFTAPFSGDVNIKVDRGGSKGDQRRTQIALWESDGTTEVNCKRYAFNDEDVLLGALGLTYGNTYYISVDAFGGYDGSFTLCIDTVPDYDFYEGAIDITSFIGGCTPDADYTTTGGSSDLLSGSCWNNSGPRYNRWFKFTAPASGEINVIVDRGGSKGDQRRTQIALWESDGTTEVSCNRYAFNDEDVELSEPNLTPGLTYYLSIDAFGGYDGSFTICLYDEVSYDYIEGAIELTDLNNWCSTDAEFTTVGGTSDQVSASCWNNSGPRYNKWFKFTAVSNTVTITIDRGGSKGDQRRTQLALWEADGTTERQCNRYTFNDEDVSLSDGTLTIGNTYYISVDAFGGYDGSFTMCIDNIDTEYYSISDGNWNNPSTWSIVSHGGAPAATFPSTGDVVYIEGHDVLANVDEACAEVRLNVASALTKLEIASGRTLNVAGKVSLINTGNNFDCEIELNSNSTLNINDRLILDRQGGSTVFELSMTTNSSLSVNKNLEINSTGGSLANTELLLSSNSNITINEDLIFTESGGGVKSQIVASNTSQISVLGDLVFTATADEKVEIEMNNSATLNVGGDIAVGSPAYGILDFNNSSVLVFNGTSKQTLPTFSGSGGTDLFDVDRIVLNNTFGAIPQFELSDDLTIDEYMSFSDGVLDCNGHNLIFAAGAYSTGDNAGSYVDGPVQSLGAFDAYFPVGDGVVWAPVELEGLTGDGSTVFTVQYFFDSYSDATVSAPLNNVSILEYWDIDNTGTASGADVTLYFKNTGRSEIDDYGDLVIAHYNSALSYWENLGQSSIVGSNPGSITVTGVSSFSPFTFGSTDPNSNPLPVTLTELTAKLLGNGNARINWTTLSEVNNDYFIVERASQDGEFLPLAMIEGAGSSSTRNDYQFTDPFLLESNKKYYYRLRQVDFNGKEHFHGPVLLEKKNNGGSFTLKAYPNPVNAGEVIMVEVERSESSNALNLALVDLQGRLIYEKEINSSTVNSVIIQIPKNLQAGLYLLRLTDSMENFTYKLSVR